MKRILPVAILFAVLLALVVAKEVARARIEGGGADTEEYVPLSVTKFAAKDAARIEVTAPGAAEPAYVLERQDGTWRMTRPFRAPAHINNADKLCEALAAGDAEMRTDDAGALRDVDLVPERSVAVRVTGADGKVLAHVAVGRSTGARGAFVRFLSQANDVRAFETTSDLRALLGLGRSATGDAEPEKPAASHFRDREFPQVALDRPKRIELVAPGRRVVLEKSGET